MARIRSIKPEACHGERLGALSSDAERLFWRLQTHCDDHGRCEDNPRVIYGACCPMIDGWDPGRVDGLLWELAEVDSERPLLDRYTDSRGRRLIQVADWSSYQRPQHPAVSKFEVFDPGRKRVRESSLTPPPEGSGGSHESSGGLRLGVEWSGVELVEGVEMNASSSRVNQEPPPQRPVHKDARERIVAAAVDVVTTRQLAAHPPPANANPVSWEASIRSGVMSDHAALFRDLVFRHPDWTPRRVADELLPIEARTVPTSESEAVRRAVKDRLCDVCDGDRCGGRGVFDINPGDVDVETKFCADVPYIRAVSDSDNDDGSEPVVSVIAATRAAIGRQNPDDDGDPPRLTVVEG